LSPRKGRGPAKKTLDLIAAIIEIAKASKPCNVRSIAYKLFSRKLIPSMEKKHVKRVSELGVMARERGMMPWDWIVDLSRPEEGVPTWKDPEDYAEFVTSFYRKNKWVEQPKHILVCSEKSTIDGVIRPVLDQYELTFQVLHGFSGATTVWNMVQANLRRKQDTLILYVGDWDPSGMWMSERDLPGRLARYSTDDPSDKDIDPEEVREILADVRLEIRRIALTEADTIAMGRALAFPASDKGPTEDSQGDSRYPWFVENYGDWCWELDALDLNVLRQRLEDTILAELDQEQWDRYVRAEKVEVESITEFCESWNSISGLDQE
jgi:hypothetical protein